MAKKIYVTDRVLYVEDTISGEFDLTIPFLDVWYREDFLENNQVVIYVRRQTQNLLGDGNTLLGLVLSNTVDINDITFTQARLRAFFTSNFSEISETTIADITEALNIDASGKQEVSQSISLGQYVLDQNDLPLKFDKETIGTGTATYNTTLNTETLTVTSNLDVAIFQTKQGHPYFPGSAQQAEFTFINLEPQTDVIKRIGYFSSSITTPFSADIDGLYLESSNGAVSLNITKSGSVIQILQSNWDDPIDGTGHSGITVDWTKFQAFIIDFLYLGGTSVALFTLQGGKRHLVHVYDHSNVIADTILNSPSKPIRAEIRSTGSAGTFHFSCGTVNSMGGDFAAAGLPISMSTGNSRIAMAVSGTEYLLSAMKKNNRFVEMIINLISITTSTQTGKTYTWRLLANPTFSAAPSFTPISNGFLDIATGDGVITITDQGHVLASGTGVSRTSIEVEISRGLRLGAKIDGTFDVYAMSFTPHDATQEVAASMDLIVIK